jgi:hypothetical protein
MCALRKQGDRAQQLGDLGVGIAMTEHRQPERCLGDEPVAWNEFERLAGRVDGVLVVTRGDDAPAARFDRDLGGAEHMARGMEDDLGAVQSHAFAITHRLRAAGEAIAIAQPHQVDGLCRGEHGAMAGPGMIGMAVGNHGLVYRPRRVDVKTAGLTKHANWRR